MTTTLPAPAQPDDASAGLMEAAHTVAARLAAQGRRKALLLVGLLALALLLFALNGRHDRVVLDIGAGVGHGPKISGAVWAVCGVGLLVAGAAAGLVWSGDASRFGKRRMSLGVVLALLAFVIGLLAWAARGGQVNVGGVLAVSVGGAVPIMLGATAGVLSERSGVFNIAIEGELLAGAFTAAIVASTTHSATAGLICGIGAGGVVGMLLALMSIRYRVDQVVAGIILISLVSGLTGYLTEQVLTPNASSLNTPPTFAPISIPGLDRIPIIGQPIFDQNIVFYLVIVLVVLVEFVLRRTRVGLRIRAVGENPAAAESSGVKVRRLRYSSVAAAGCIAGAGGAYFTVGSTGQFVAGMSSGLGYVALAAVILGAWRPAQAVAAALLFGFASSIATTFGLLKVDISPSLLLMAPYIVTIVVVAGVTTSGKAPAAAGGRLDS